eukprot:10210639-Alexandrium_andersonii.AAC.1
MGGSVTDQDATTPCCRMTQRFTLRWNSEASRRDELSGTSASPCAWRSGSGWTSCSFLAAAFFRPEA